MKQKKKKCKQCKRLLPIGWFLATEKDKKDILKIGDYCSLFWSCP